MGLPARDLEIRALRGVLAERFPDAMPLSQGTVATVATGVGALDGVLPNGGLPRGALSVWRMGGGADATLRSACAAAVARGERAVWVDGAGTVVGDVWPAGVLLVRPEDERGALSAAEELLRSGGFALVVVSGAAAGAERESVRLSRVARDGGGALVLLGRPLGRGEASGVPGSGAARLRLWSRYRPEGHVWHPDPFGDPAELESLSIEVEARSMGWSREVTYSLPVKDHAHRLSLDPRLVDRRGAADRDVRAALEAEAGVLGRFDADRRTGPAGAGGVAAGGGAAGGDRSARPDLGRRGWPGRESVRRGAAGPGRRGRVA